jgi:hypothetical protein
MTTGRPARQYDSTRVLAEPSVPERGREGPESALPRHPDASPGRTAVHPFEPFGFNGKSTAVDPFRTFGAAQETETPQRLWVFQNG